MREAQQVDSPSADLREGATCMMNVMGEHFMVEILEVGSDGVRVSFPGQDYPVEGTMVALEFHDMTGFNYYNCTVAAGPEAGRGAVLLRQPNEMRRSRHRDTARVPTDLTVQIKDHVHVRSYDGGLLDLSVGGCLVETEATFDFHSNVEVTISLPGEPTRTLLGQVVHVNTNAPSGRQGKHLVGIRFIDVEPLVAKSIMRYTWRRLKDLYTED